MRPGGSTPDRALRTPSEPRRLTGVVARARNLERRYVRAGGDGVSLPGRMVWGSVYNDANIISGTGFTVAWADHLGGSPSSNIHTITFDTPFTNPPVVLLTANNDNPPATEGAYGVSIKSKDAGGSWVEVEMVNFDGTTGDGGYDFAAIEPGV
jgi:hypothetical protein